MAKIDIFSGFLGAGKTTLIKKLLGDGFSGEKIVLIENEFGDIGIDGTFMQEAGVLVNEMNSGCICCSLVGDFSKAVEKVINEYAPDRIIIEPSGVGKLSDVISAVENLKHPEIQLNGFITVVDGRKCKMYMKNFGEFYNNQLESCDVIILSHTQSLSEAEIENTVKILREKNSGAVIITTDWEKLTGAQIIAAIEQNDGLKKRMSSLLEDVKAGCHGNHHDESCCGHHEHEHHHHDESCCGHHEHEHHHDENCCGHHEHEHHHDENCCGHHKHEHHHDENCCGHHEHEHHHDESCCGHHKHEHHHDESCCGHHEHHHDGSCCGHHEHEHEHLHASDVFTSVGMETTKHFSRKELEDAVGKLDDTDIFGQVLRAKGVVEGDDGTWIHFDYVPGDVDIRTGTPAITGMICVIGASIDEARIKDLFLD